MVKLRHILGSNLKELEATLEKSKVPLVILNVNKVGANWYIHFLAQTLEKTQGTPTVEFTEGTKTSVKKTKKKRTKKTLV